jgi:hypothetical protein
VVLNDLVASGIVALGEFRSHEVYVSLDDIASDTYMKSLISNYNILAVSSYSYVDRKAKKRDQYSGILLRTVMERLRQDSPDGYVAVQTALSKQSNLEPGTVVRCNVAGPPSSEQTFPLNELLIVSFESGDSRSERFAWLADAIKITERLPGSNLIVPCLGRNWLRNKSIDFADFFDNALRVIPMSGNVKLYLSLYSQWPTFELERAAAAINSSWKRLVS